MARYALIAEADASQAQLYRHMVEAQGLSTKVVRDGSEALALIRTHGAPALTVTELSLPRVDGFKLIEEIRKLAPPEEAKVVAISAFRTLRDAAVKQRQRIGINELLARSAPVESIFRAIGRAAAVPLENADDLEIVDAELIVSETERTAEAGRLQQLEDLQLVDEGDVQDEDLRRIVDEVAKRFSVPMALITFVLKERQWFKAHVGLAGQLLQDRGSPRDWSFCTHVVQGAAPLVIPDAAVHPSFATNELVRRGVFRSYAGVPLQTASGDVLGSLCILDQKPMAISAEDVDELVLLARNVAGELELRSARKRRTTAPAAQHLEYFPAILENIADGIFLLDQDRRAVLVNRAGAAMFGRMPESIAGKTRDQFLGEVAQLAKDPNELRRKLRVPATGAYALHGEFELRLPVRRIVRWTTKPVEIRGGVGHLVVVRDITAETDLLRERAEKRVE